MPTDLALAVLDLFLDLGLKDCTLVGGEPTLHPNLTDVIARGTASGMRMFLVTNGRKLLDIDYCAQLTEAGASRISVSLEGPTADIHDFITQRPGSFDDTLAGVTNLIESRFPVDIITTICRSNAPHLQRMIDLLLGIGMSNAVFNLCTPSIWHGAESGELLDMHAMGVCVSQLFRSAPRNVRVRVVTPFPLCLLDDELMTAPLGVCQMFHGEGVTVDADGSVLPCTHFSGAGLFNVFCDAGVMSAAEFLDTWVEASDPFRERLWRYPDSACSECSQWERCYGGCPLYWSVFKPSASLKSISPSAS